MRDWRRLERIGDILPASAFLAAGLLLLWLVPEAAIDVDPHRVSPPPWASAAMVVAASVGALHRRRHPIVALTVACVVLLAGIALTGAAPLGAVLIFVDALYCAVRFTSRRASWAVVVASGVALILPAVAVFVFDGGRAAARTVLDLALVLLVPVLWGREVRRHVEFADVERARAEQARRIAELDQAAAITAERARMARDLHDIVAGQLSAIAIQSEAALISSDPDPHTLRRVLTTVRRDSVASLTEMRTMIGLLRTDGAADTDPRTAPAGLDRLDALFDAGEAMGLRIEVDDRRSATEPLPAAINLTAYRIIAESLTNAAKHAPGATVHLRLSQAAGVFVIELENDLVPGCAPGSGTGTGLLGLHERAVAVGGTVTAGPTGSTWKVHAALPAAPAGTSSEGVDA